MLFYNHVLFKFINVERNYKVAYAELHDVKLDFRFGLQTVLSLKGVC